MTIIGKEYNSTKAIYILQGNEAKNFYLVFQNADRQFLPKKYYFTYNGNNSVCLIPSEDLDTTNPALCLCGIDDKVYNKEFLQQGSGGDGQPTNISSTTLDVGGSGYSRTVNLKADTQTTLGKAEKLIINGNGTTFLANDGNYKAVPGGGIADITTNDSRVSITKNNGVANIDTTGITGSGVVNYPFSTMYDIGTYQGWMHLFKLGGQHDCRIVFNTNRRGSLFDRADGGMREIMISNGNSATEFAWSAKSTVGSQTQLYYVKNADNSADIYCYVPGGGHRYKYYYIQSFDNNAVVVDNLQLGWDTPTPEPIEMVDTEINKAYVDSAINTINTDLSTKANKIIQNDYQPITGHVWDYIEVKDNVAVNLTNGLERIIYLSQSYHGSCLVFNKNLNGEFDIYFADKDDINNGAKWTWLYMYGVRVADYDDGQIHTSKDGNLTIQYIGGATMLVIKPATDRDNTFIDNDESFQYLDNVEIHTAVILDLEDVLRAAEESKDYYDLINHPLYREVVYDYITDFTPTDNSSNYRPTNQTITLDKVDSKDISEIGSTIACDITFATPTAGFGYLSATLYVNGEYYTQIGGLAMTFSGTGQAGQTVRYKWFINGYLSDFTPRADSIELRISVASGASYITNLNIVNMDTFVNGKMDPNGRLIDSNTDKKVAYLDDIVPPTNDISRPNTWQPGVEIDFGGGLFGFASSGTISAGANEEVDTEVVPKQINPKHIVNYGGCWHYNNAAVQVAQAIGGHYEGSTGTISSTIGLEYDSTNYQNWIALTTQSNAQRTNLPWECWVLYTKV